MSMVDLGPQARIVAELAEAVGDERPADPTPCPGCAVRNLLGHLLTLSVAFRDAARKDLGPTTDTSPGAVMPDLGPGVLAELPEALDELAEAWRDPAAWTGFTRAGGVDLPGAVAGAVAADELVVHGWDLARSTGRSYRPDPGALEAAHTSSWPPPRPRPGATPPSARSSRSRPPRPCWTARSA
ncbi:TIGR03086 family metal-binding protein [Streptomyces cellostaticus]|uniref:TIGR03086 family metal-binding protein n=1 Tax=Streptomyces cellostaticus TaxID=67285 RepID=UPI0020261570|nr:TIGR03086 family metal-binding protein [Streptomyces cellostaticus]